MILREQVGTQARYANGTYIPPSKDFAPKIEGLRTPDHGGQCCGMTHIHTFPSIDATVEQKAEWINKAIDNKIAGMVCDDEDCFCDQPKYADEVRHCFEVVLAESQLSGWCEALEKVGFKQVYSFLNTNSGNECSVFLFETNRPK